MALITCKECAARISDRAGQCPQCGAPRKAARTTSLSTKIIAGIFGLAIVGAISSRMDKQKVADEQSSAASARQQQRLAAMTPEQRAAEATARTAAKAAEESAKKAFEAADSKRLTIAATAATAVQSAMRNPDSMKWESISANNDASVVCLEYRSQNGFGGMSREFVVYKNKRPSQSAAAWNKNCVDTALIDMRRDVEGVLGVAAMRSK